jgi:hypothetical protein
MRKAGRDDNETACRISIQLIRIEPLALSEIPGPFDNRKDFVVQVRVCENASALGYVYLIHPRADLIRFAEQLRLLPPSS